MAIVTRSAKGSPLSHSELDNNFLETEQNAQQASSDAQSASQSASSASASALIATTAKEAIESYVVPTEATYTYSDIDSLLATKLDHNNTIYTSGGNVGIGTSSPDDKLEVNGDIRLTDGGAYVDRAINFEYNNGVFARIIGNAGSGSPLYGDIDFQTNDSVGTGPFTRVSIRRDGGITFNGDTSTANALDDYEEGTWTPTLGASSGASMPTTISSHSCHYTKVGNKVTVTGRVVFSNGGAITVDDRIIIGGLPFSPGKVSGNNQAVGSCFVYSSFGSGNNAMGCSPISTAGVWAYIEHVDGSINWNTSNGINFTVAYLTN